MKSSRTVYLRRHGVRVRSAIFQAISPPDSQRLLNFARDAKDSLEQSLEDYRSSGKDRDDPDLDREMEAILRRLNESPAEVVFPDSAGGRSVRRRPGGRQPSADWRPLMFWIYPLAIVVLVTVGCASPRLPRAEDGAAIARSSTPTAAEGRLGEEPARENSRDGLKYLWIAPGKFEMGCAHDDGECREDEKPRRRVALHRGFWMAATEVTVDAFRRFMSDSKYVTTAEREGFGGILNVTGWENVKGAHWRSPGFVQEGLQPVVLVSWNDAHAFCEWSGGRLPSEVEWEYAARGGLEGTRYVWGDSPIPVVNGRKYANVADESAAGVSTPAFESTYNDGAPYTSPAGTFEPNRFGLYDMAGNVLEWCGDIAPRDQRVARGGAWNNPPELLRVSRRSRFASRTRLTILGFRCARDAAPN